jgi:hypothetical protein
MPNQLILCGVAIPSQPKSNDSTMFKSVITLLALLGSASAFLPVSAPMRVSTAMSSKFDNKVWGIEQKKEIYE